MKQSNIGDYPVKTWGFLGLNTAAVKAEKENLIKNVCFKSTQGEEKTERITLRDSADITVTAEKNSILTSFITTCGSEDISVNISADVESGASLKIVFSALNDHGSRLIANIHLRVGSGASIALYSLFTENSSVYADHKTELLGDESRLLSKTYYLTGENVLDMNYAVTHIGKNSHSETFVNGALDGECKKIFRGTIDLQNGASGSSGAETENVLLLSDNVENKTMPVILCSEEDVRGEHGATIGDLSDDTLFYFESRGISESEAKSLLKNSIADSFCREVGDKETTKKIYAKMGWENE